MDSSAGCHKQMYWVAWTGLTPFDKNGVKPARACPCRLPDSYYVRLLRPQGRQLPSPGFSPSLSTFWIALRMTVILTLADSSTLRTTS